MPFLLLGHQHRGVGLTEEARQHEGHRLVPVAVVERQGVLDRPADGREIRRLVRVRQSLARDPHRRHEHLPQRRQELPVRAVVLTHRARHARREERRGRHVESLCNLTQRVQPGMPALLDVPYRAQGQTGLLREPFLSPPHRTPVRPDGISQRGRVVRHTETSVLTSTLKTVLALTPRDCPEHTGR